jgi:hypothetical protein
MNLQQRVADLVEQYLEGTLDAEGRRELLRRLQADVDVRRAFLEQLDLSNLVSELYRAEDFTVNTVDRILWTTRLPQVPDVWRSTRRTGRRQSSEPTPSGMAWAFGAAAILIVGAITSFWSSSETNPGMTRRFNETRARTSKETPSEREWAEAPLRGREGNREALSQPDSRIPEDLSKGEKRRKDLDAPKRDPDRIEEPPWKSVPLAGTSEIPVPSGTPHEAHAPPGTPIPPPGATQATLAQVEEIEGEAFRVTPQGKSPLRLGADILAAEGLETGGGTSRMVLRFADKTRVEVGPESAIAELKVDSGKRLEVARGTVRAVVARQPKDQPLVLATPHGQAVVVGTTLRIVVDPDPAKGTRLDVEEGKVELQNLAGKAVMVESGHFAVAATGIELVAKPLAFWEGALAVYLFNEGRGNRVHDVSRKGSPLDLRIEKESSVRWLPRGIAIVSPTLLSSVRPARKIIDACKATNELTLEAWIRPATLTPVERDNRIVTLSADWGNQNFFLGQEAAEGPTRSYFMRFRTTETDSIGKPILASTEGKVELKLVHVVYTRSSKGAAVLYVEGEEESKATTAGTLATWDEGYRLGLGNELTHNRSWLGEYHFLALYSRTLSAEEVRQHYRAGVE